MIFGGVSSGGEIQGLDQLAGFVGAVIASIVLLSLLWVCARRLKWERYVLLALVCWSLGWASRGQHERGCLVHHTEWCIR